MVLSRKIPGASFNALSRVATSILTGHYFRTSFVVLSRQLTLVEVPERHISVSVALCDHTMVLLSNAACTQPSLNFNIRMVKIRQLPLLGETGPHLGWLIEVSQLTVPFYKANISGIAP